MYPLVGFVRRSCQLCIPAQRPVIGGAYSRPDVTPIKYRPDVTSTKYRPAVAQLKRENNKGRDARNGDEKLAVMLAELVYQSVHVIEKLYPEAVMRLESEHGRSVIQSGESLLVIQLMALQKWSLDNQSLLETCASEIAWCLDNYQSVGATHLSLCADTMNGFFLGPQSVSEILEHLFAWVCKCAPESGAARLTRERLLQTVTAVQYEKLGRLVGTLAIAERNLAEAHRVLEGLNSGTYRLRSVVQSLPVPNLEESCREALVITAAARLGIRIVGEKQLMDVARLLDTRGGGRNDVTLLGPGIVPRRLWDCLLPFVSVDHERRTMRGTVDEVDWLVTHSYSGVGVGVHRLYGSRVGKDAVAAGIGVVREWNRPKITLLNPSEVATLEWIFKSGNKYIEEAYMRFRDLARAGYGHRSRSTAAVWLRLYDKVRAEDPAFADGLFSTSMTSGVMGLMAVASESVVSFREGLLLRVVGTLSTEECSIETQNGSLLKVERNDNGDVVLTLPRGKFEGFLTVLAERIDRYCASFGTRVRSSLGYRVLKRTVPDFVGPASVESFTPAMWINMLDINIPTAQPSDPNS